MQLIHYKGACMTIKSATELNNARQLWLDCDVYNALDDYLKCGTSKSSIDIMQIWDALFDAVNEYLLVSRPLLLPKKADRAFFDDLLRFKATVIAYQGHWLLGSFHHARDVW